jgi:hypothetical protein
MKERFSVINGGREPSERTPLTQAKDKIDRQLIPFKDLFAPNFSPETYAQYIGLSESDLCYEIELVCRNLAEATTPNDYRDLLEVIEKAYVLQSIITGRAHSQ